MATFILPASCVAGTVECNDTSGFSIGWPDLLLSLAIAGILVACVVLLVRSHRRR
ncbi:hypothetical protein [Arthrobacter sp. PAMC 25486]|uniref:hypothetical protein n=1 Tax=Arthrobacter sp. PAMC 25486 TaxID=1494608 RepID=UPI0012FED388|nr:hypothetical protein [Arthrobacter sp. PAMC 25486]